MNLLLRHHVVIQITVDGAETGLLFEADLDVRDVRVSLLEQVFAVLAHIVPQELDALFFPLADVDQFVGKQIRLVSLVALDEDDPPGRESVRAGDRERHLYDPHFVCSTRSPIDNEQHTDAYQRDGEKESYEPNNDSQKAPHPRLDAGWYETQSEGIETWSCSFDAGTENCGERLEVVAANRQHSTIEVLALHLNHREITRQHVGFWA